MNNNTETEYFNSADNSGNVISHPAKQKQDDSGLSMVCLADVKPESIKWLWSGVLALGKLTLVGGYPGVGKSQVAASITAMVTSGAIFPGSDEAGIVGSVLFVGLEDGLADTLSPRMQAAGANLNKVHIVQGKPFYMANGEQVDEMIDVTKDLEILGREVERLGDVRLIIFDPINDYVGEGKQSDNADMRKALVPLQAFAEKHSLSVLAITHLKKSSGGGEPIDAFISSRAFTGVARSVFAVAKHPDDEEKRLFISVKNNIEKDTGGYSFGIESATVAGTVETSRVVWDQEPIKSTASEIMRDSAGDSDERSRVDEAAVFLAEWFLREPNIKGSEVYKSARREGISDASIKRAKKKLGIKSKKEPDAWYWVTGDDELLADVLDGQ